MSESGSVVQEWVGQSCTWKMQTVLLCALRGCDGVPKEDLSKSLTRQLRKLVLHNASGPIPDRFMEAHDLAATVRIVAADLDHYPVHWVMHTAHAFEIIAYKHPNPQARYECFEAYTALVRALHLNTETEEQLNLRLADGEGKVRTQPEDVFPKVITEIRHVGGGYRG